MKAPTALWALALPTLLAGAAMAAPQPDMEDVPLTLTGCVVAGEEDDSFLLTNVVIDGTTLAPVNAFYRLDDAEDLENHVGHRVEVKGKADLDDEDKGELTVEVEDGTRTTELSSERRTVTLEEESIWFGTLGSMTLTGDVPTYKFKVDDIARLHGNCAHAAVVR